MSGMQGGHDEEPEDGTATPDGVTGSRSPVRSVFDSPPVDPDLLAGTAPPRRDEPILPTSEARAPLPMIDPVTQPRPGAATWYRTDEERARSVYRRANPWYRRLARGVIGLAFLGLGAIGVYAGALAVQSYVERDQLPAQGVELPEIRATSLLVTSTAPAPAVDGTLTLDAATSAFEFVGRASGPQSGLQVVSPDGTTVYLRRGAGPWRSVGAADVDAEAVLTAVTYLADDDSADDILTNRLRRGFVELLAKVDEGTGDARLTRYEMALDTEQFARDFPLQWQEFRSGAVPGSTPGTAVPVTIWLDRDGVLMRVRDEQTNWVWERLTYSDQPFQPLDPTSEAETRIVQVACVSDDNSIFWQTPFASCAEALAVAREAASASGAGGLDDLDRTIARLCSTMEREDGPLPATPDEATLAAALVEAGVCRGDPAIFAPG